MHTAVVLTLLGSELLSVYVAFSWHRRRAALLRSAARLFLIAGPVVMLIDALTMYRRGDFVELADSKLAEANAAMRERQYTQARNLFTAAEVAGADKATCRYGAAECSFYLKDDAAAAILADELLTTPSGAGYGRRVRGWLRERQGLRLAARHEYESGARAGDPVCASLLATLKDG